ncbi:MAG: hypothetical protein V3U13_10840 [Gemmatimonadota bacterium]|jgi:hypothetical protein
MRRVAWLPASLGLLAIIASPVRAQFEEPDTIPRFSIGATAELVFRGKRGETSQGTDVSFGGGPALGLRLEYRLTSTLGIAAAGSWAHPKERLRGANFAISSSDAFNMWQFSGELMLRVKPKIPGFFILGGGVRYTDPVSVDPGDYQHNVTSFTEPLGIIGAGVELARRRSRLFKVDFRLYMVAPSDQLKFETKSVELDLGVDLEFLLRF